MALEDVIKGQLDASGGDEGNGAEGVVENDTTVVENGTDGQESVENNEPDAGEQAAEAARKAVEDAEQAFAKEHELLDKAGKRENRIPYLRVKKIVENARLKLAKQVMGDAWKDLGKDQKLDDVIGAHLEGISKRLANYDTYERELASVDAVGKLMQSDPERFLEMLPHVNPRYRELIGAVKDAQRQAENTNTDDQMPGPDLDLGNGKMTYSPQGLQKLLNWQIGQTKKQVLGEVEKTYKPIKESHDAQTAINASLQRVRARLEDARKNWRGFTEHEDAIREEVNKGADLAVAYARVIDRVRAKELEDAKADREKIRKELLEEIQKAPRSTSTSVQSRGAKADDGEPKSLEDIIRQAVEKGGKG